MGEVIEFQVSLPPAALRSNSRAHWKTKYAAKQAYSGEALYTYEAVKGAWMALLIKPWKQAKVTYTWRYCGVAPDRQNLGANLKALTDIICCAPNNGLQANHTTYLGLIEDDKGIDPHYALERVKRRVEQCVVIKIERLRCRWQEGEGNEQEPNCHEAQIDTDGALGLCPACARPR